MIDPIDKRDSCHARQHHECYCGALDVAREDFYPYDQEELDMYNEGAAPEDKLTMQQVEARDATKGEG